MIRRSPDLKSSTGATTTFIALPPPGSGRMAHTCPTGEHASAGLGRAGAPVFVRVRLRHFAALTDSPREGGPARSWRVVRERQRASDREPTRITVGFRR